MNKNPVLSGIRWTFLTSILRRVFTLILFYFVAQWLSKDDLGIFREYSIILSFLSLISILSLDYHYIIEKQRKTSSLVALWQITIVVSIIGFIVLSLCSGVIGYIYKSGILAKLFRYTSVFFVIEILRRTVRSMSTNYMQFKEMAVAETLNVIFYSIASLLILYFYRNLWVFVIAFYLGNAVELVYLWHFNRIMIHKIIVRAFTKSKRKLLGMTLRYNRVFLWQATLVSSLNQISSNAPILILGMIVKPELIGLYFFASQVIGIPVTMFTNAISQVFFPVFAGRKDGDISNMSSRYIRLVGFLGLPVLLIFSYLMIFVITWLFHGKWDDAIPLIMPLFLLFGTSLYCNPLSGIPFIKRKPYWELIWNICGVVIKILAILIGFTYSFVTAIWLFSIASSLSQFAFYLMSMVLIQQKILQTFIRLILSLIPTIIISIVMGIVFNLSPLLSSIIVIISGIILFYISNIYSKGILVSDIRFLLKR